MDAKNDLYFVIFVLILLGIAWLVTGGPSRSDSQFPFLKPPPPLGSGELYGEGEGILSFLHTSQSGAGEQGGNGRNGVPAAPSGEMSPVGGTVSLADYGSRAIKPVEEYLELRVSGAPVTITGWRLRSKNSGKEARIGTGAALPYSGQVNAESSIALRPNERALIITGQSPIGVSFRLNKCTGYFEQFQDFTPPLPLACPSPRNELARLGAGNLSDQCIAYIEGLQSCQMPFSIPPTLPATCHDFITANLSYSACVSAHRADSDFEKGEWRIYLGRNEKLWKGRLETIELLDAGGKILNTLTTY